MWWLIFPFLLIIILIALLLLSVYIKIKIKIQNILLEKNKKHNDTSSLIPYKNEIGSISQLNIQNDKTVEIEQLWNDINKLKKQNRILVEKGFEILNNKNIFKVNKCLSEIEKNQKTIAKKDALFYELTNSILVDRKMISSQLIHYKKATREIKSEYDKFKDDLHLVSKNHFSLLFNQLQEYCKSISASLTEMDETKAKKQFVELTGFFNNFLIFVDNCEKVDWFIFVECLKLEKSLKDHYSKLQIQLNSNLDFLNFSEHLNSAQELRKELENNYHKKNEKEIITQMKKIIKIYSLINQNLNKELRCYNFFVNKAENFKIIYKDINEKLIKVISIVEKAKKIDNFYFNDWAITKDKLNSLLEEVTENINDGLLEVDELNVSYSKKLISLKHTTNSLNALNILIDEYYAKVKYFYYESSSPKLKYEILVKIILLMNYLSKSEKIKIPLKIQNNKETINKMMQNIHTLMIENIDDNFELHYKNLYEVVILYLKELALIIYRVKLFKKLYYDYNKKRSTNLSLHKDIINVEKIFYNGKYSQALDEFIKVAKKGVN